MRNKGKRYEKHLADYIVFDIETCGLSMFLRKNVIEISAVKVRNGKVVDEFSSLIKPGIKIPAVITELTGIDDSMVSEAPQIKDVMVNFLDFIGDDVLVGYNINTFDYNILYDLSYELLNREINNCFVDIFYAARRNKDVLGDTKLSSVCEYFNVDTTNAHRALKDCYLTKAAYDHLYESFGERAFCGEEFDVDQCSRTGQRLTEESILLQELQGILIEIVEDDIVTEDEVISLSEWMETNAHLRGNYPFDRVYNLLEQVWKDGVIDNDELDLLLDKFIEYIDPVRTTCEEASKLEIEGKHFVLTGDFEYGNRSSVEELLVSLGGIIDHTVKKCTDYVLVGSLGSQNWKNGNYGGKIKKAIELIDKGLAINIINESDFFEVIKGE